MKPEGSEENGEEVFINLMNFNLSITKRADRMGIRYKGQMGRRGLYSCRLVQKSVIFLCGQHKNHSINCKKPRKIQDKVKGKDIPVTGHGGRAIAQAVSRRLSTVAARVKTRVWSCGIL
jgi:hypothetical protein